MVRITKEDVEDMVEASQMTPATTQAQIERLEKLSAKVAEPPTREAEAVKEGPPKRKRVPLDVTAQRAAEGDAWSQYRIDLWQTRITEVAMGLVPPVLSVNQIWEADETKLAGWVAEAGKRIEEEQKRRAPERAARAAIEKEADERQAKKDKKAAK